MAEGTTGLASGGRRALWRPWVFPVALWFVATFFLLGNLGKYLDDWYYLQRDPGSGAVQSWVLARPLHFWRPLYRVVVPSLITAFWHAEWAVHLISALAHGGVALVLWKLLRELRAPPLGAALGALVFLVWPAYFEAVLWMCALPTVLSAGVVAAAWLVHARWARGEAGWWAAAAMPVLFFASASLNEQAATGLAVLPFLYLAARRPEPWRRSAARTLIPTALAWAALVAYVALHTSMKFPVPATDRRGFFTQPGKMPGLALSLAGWLRGEFLSTGFLRRACEVGFATLREYPVRASAAAVALGLGLVWWARDVAARDPDRGARTGWLAAAGLAAFLAPLVPIVVFAYWFDPRVAYAPAMGIPLLIGSASALAAHRGGSARMRRTVATTAGAGLVIPAVAMVGLQRGYRDRAKEDASEVAQLRALMPEPARGTVFVPLRIDMPPAGRGGAARFDLYYWSGFQSWWAARWLIEFGYGRADLNSGHAQWGECGVARAQPRVADVRGVGRTAWERIVPFVIDGDGRIHLVGRIRTGELTVEPAQTRRLTNLEEVIEPADRSGH